LASFEAKGWRWWTACILPANSAVIRVLGFPKSSTLILSGRTVGSLKKSARNPQIPVRDRLEADVG